MEDKTLALRRILYIILCILSLIFISFFGGDIPYMFFFALVFNSCLMLLYVLYVFFSIKIYQSVTSRQMTKQELVSYRLLLTNEGLIAYRDIHLNFMELLSEVKGVQDLGHLSLEPNQGIEQNMELLCKYSGTFFVGVDTVEIMDYFKILKIRFPMPQKMKVTVKPRLLIPGNLSFITKYEECHDVSQNYNSNDIIDNTVRKYVPGDNKHLIHWKNSAKRQELMLRTMIAEEIFKYVIVMDKKVSCTDSLQAIMQSDKLRELTLAMVYYIFDLGFYVEVFLGERYHSQIASLKDFEDFFEVLTEYEFDSSKTSSSFDRFLQERNKEYEKNVPFVVTTANAEPLDSKMLNTLSGYRNLHILDVNTFEDIEEFLHVEEKRDI